MLQRISLWDVPVDSASPIELAQYVLRRLSPRKVFFIATPNPEILLASRRDALLKKILKRADLNIPDGTGLVWALRRRVPKRQARRVRRVSGVDFMETLLAILPDGQRVLFFGSTKTSVNTAAQACSKQFPRHTFAAVPGEIPAIRRLLPHNQALKHFQAPAHLKTALTKTKPTILFVGLGAPLQEKWLAANAKRLRSVRLAMGVGGAFDMISGVRPRAPRFLQYMGLEWLWRVSQEPRRIRRILRAVIIFPILTLVNK